MSRRRATGVIGPAKLDDLGLCRCTEYGKTFETGKPVSFRYLHNTDTGASAHYGSLFGQDIEPDGKYMLHKYPASKPTRGWVTGTIRFRKPLVLALGSSDIYGPSGWKARLSSAFGAKGAALSTRLRAHGYDGIITCASSTETSEIVALRAKRSRRR